MVLRVLILLHLKIVHPGTPQGRFNWQPCLGRAATGRRQRGAGSRMSLLLGVLSQVLSWASLCQVLKMVGTGLVAVVAVWIVRLFVHHAWYTHRLSCFSKPPADSWLKGHLGQMQSTEEGLLQVDDLVRTYKHSCSWFLGPFYHLVRVFHPDYVKPLLMASASITVKDELIYDHLRPWLGQSLLLSNGEVWSRRRRLLTPAFHFDILKNYVVTFNTSANTMHDKWRRLVAEGRTNLEMFDHITLMTLDSLLKCAFSYNSNCQESTSEYVSAIVELSDLIIDRRLKILHHWDWIYWKTQQGKQFKKALSVVHRFTREVVQKRRALIGQQKETETDFTKAPQRKRDFVDIILLSKDEDGQGLTDEEIQAEANTFMFAGHDTTASAICWTLYNLARHAEYQERCRQEVMDLMQGRDREEIEWEDLANLTFTTMCIRESLRLHSPVQAVTRKYTQDMVLPGNRTVPEGTICLVSIYGTHHNPTVWTNPYEFEPLRFDPADTENRSSHAFIPFSSGPRNCIGQKFALAELRVVVALTLLRFRLTLGVNPELGSSSGGVRRLPQLVLRAEGGLWLQLEPLTTPNMEEPQAE
ncbi:cytochrome P450 4F3 isoform X1 [Seriola aureovittata]|uniref:cytochrome P450 4F3 isoform X1 n=1 Tax=Seriola aureovittata TaxID=2871759 RepID=UPI0024BD9F75|nr:cytochrome P450 4F3 isoform X1 [Seriola aureovittata]XP_056226006.1 cytochrome P450 4F3 isoform X1 [Seriola aureovittata]XP_056226007.1 cytochrome P450 4F3 isoform X1 [Seriola aureovittata]